MTGTKQTTDGGDPTGYMTGYTYTLGGSLDTETYPSGRVVKNELNNDGSLSLVESKKDASHGFWTYANSFTYNPAGAVTSMQLGNGHWESTVFNTRLQPTQIALGTVPNGIDKLKLNYDYGSTANNGNVQSQTITVPTVGSNTGFVAVQNYSYDELNRLKDATENVTPTGGSASQSWKQTFSYDRYGNRNFDQANTTQPASFANPSVTNPTVNTANNRFASGQGYSYDSSGNTTADANGQSYVYDAENKMVSASDASETLGEYFYDGDGKRIKKYVPSTGETTIFAYDAAGKEIAEYSTIVANSTDAKVNYLTTDHLGSPRINTDQNGAFTARHDYTPFGEEVATSQRSSSISYQADSMRKQFTGYERDQETSLDSAQARMYSDSLGRFTSSDPINTITLGKLDDPQQSNLYSYSRNNPLKFTDPDGMKIVPCTADSGSECDGKKRMNAEESAQWEMTKTLANLQDGLGNYYFPDLHSTYKRLDDDPRTFFVVAGTLDNQTVGQTDITKLTSDGKDFTEATITLNFSLINSQATTSNNEFVANFRKFDGLLGKQNAYLRVAEVFGHEGNHGVWALDHVSEAVELQSLINDGENRRARMAQFETDKRKIKNKKDREKFQPPPDLIRDNNRYRSLYTVTETYAEQKEQLVNLELQKAKKK